MSLTDAVTLASQSLGTISSQIGVVSRNISSAGTPGVSEKNAIVTTGPTGGAVFQGVRRSADDSLMRSLLLATAKRGASEKISGALDQVDRALNLSDPTQSRAPAVMISKLSGALQAYSATPDNETAAQLTLSAAKDVVSALNDAADLIQTIRSESDADIAIAVAGINDTLQKIASVNREIVAGGPLDVDVSDALDRRDALISSLAAEVGLKIQSRPNNDMVIYTDSGITLFETTPRLVSFEATATYSAGIEGKAVYIDGVKATGTDTQLALRSGAIAGRANFRDQTAPMLQSQLDEIARGLVVAFSESDQSGAGAPARPGLFTYQGATDTPAAAIIPGLANILEVNAAVDPDRGGNILKLRDGGISGNPNYLYNSDQASGYSERLLQLAQVAAQRQNFDPAAGVGSEASLNGFAAESIGWLGAQRQQALREATYNTALADQATVALSNATGVNLDDQMARMLGLENAFQASARLLQTINAVYDALFAAIGR
jgi:flagellar hook-associated protein 1 FlgK